MLMLWAIFPILAQLFYTSGSYIQNYLTDFAFPKKKGGALIAAHIPLFIFILLILFAIFGRTVFVLPLHNAIGLIVAGAVNVVGSAYYYKAFQEGDAADVVVISQLSPLVTLGLGAAILGETISANQGIGILLIMAAALLIVFGNMSKRERNNPNIKVAVITIIGMFFSNFSDIIYALYIKDFTADLSILCRGMFFFYIGSALAATVCFICFTSWRKALKTAFVKSRNRSRNTLALVGDSLLFMFGEFVYKYGLLIVPVIAMMSAVGKVTSLFVSLFFTIFLGRIFPKFIHSKRITRKVAFRYMIAAVLIVSGILIMN